MEPFIISFWHDPPLNLDRYRELAECGFTLAAVHAQTPAEGKQALELCAQVGLKAMIIDPRITQAVGSPAGWEELVQQAAADYRGHPALWGYYITDEPGAAQFSQLARIHCLLRQVDPAAVPYINLFPNYASSAQLGTVSYREHVRRFIDLVQPLYLSYDHYAFFEDHEFSIYFENLEIARAEALHAGIPFWQIILSCALFNYRDPTPADLRYGVYTTLAYGGKALAYYTYWTADGYSFREGPLNKFGDRTPLYGVIQQLNLEMQHLGPWLNGLISTRVRHWPDAPIGAQVLDDGGIIVEISGGEFVIGEFRDTLGLPWIMVTNRSREHSAWVTIKLRTPYTEISEVARSTGELRPIARDQGTRAAAPLADGMVVQFWLAPADGRLVRLSAKE
ncbi:MAG: hypothetical protein LLG44_03255 [Chloroflexi bacterium]|nr:hypothetical protein [Chloroflexota bacterium]